LMSDHSTAKNNRRRPKSFDQERDVIALNKDSVRLHMPEWLEANFVVAT
jgi:hypothetical protein